MEDFFIWRPHLLIKFWSYSSNFDEEYRISEYFIKHNMFNKKHNMFEIKHNMSEIKHNMFDYKIKTICHNLINYNKSNYSSNNVRQRTKIKRLRKKIKR